MAERFAREVLNSIAPIDALTDPRLIELVKDKVLPDSAGKMPDRQLPLDGPEAQTLTEIQERHGLSGRQMNGVIYSTLQAVKLRRQRN